MAPPAQSTKMRLLMLLQDSLRNQPNMPVSLSELARTLSVSRERIHKLYRQLAVEHNLPPIRMQKKLRSETSRKLPNPKTRAFETEVRMYIALGMNATEIARITGRNRRGSVTRMFHRLGVPWSKRSRRSG